MTSVIEAPKVSTVRSIPHPQGFSSLELPEHFGPKRQQGPYDIWAHPLSSGIAIVVSTDRTPDGDVEPGLGAMRARMSAFASYAVRSEMPVNTVAVLHPNVHLVVPLSREHRARVTAEVIDRKIDPHAKKLAAELGRAGKRAEEVLRSAGYTAQEFQVRIGRNQEKRRVIGVGLLSPETAVILNKKSGDPVRSIGEWEEMLFDITGVERTPFDSDPESIRNVIGSIRSLQEVT